MMVRTGIMPVNNMHEAAAGCGFSRFNGMYFGS
jgi:hypothetical protein